MAQMGAVPAGGVGVGDAVGDVEPAEVVVEVELAGRVVAQHPLGHRVDDDVEHAVDTRAVAQRVDGGVERGGAVAAVEQCGVAAGRRRAMSGRHRRRCSASRSTPASAFVNGRMYGSVSSRVP